MGGLGHLSSRGEDWFSYAVPCGDPVQEDSNQMAKKSASSLQLLISFFLFPCLPPFLFGDLALGFRLLFLEPKKVGKKVTNSQRWSPCP